MSSKNHQDRYFFMVLLLSDIKNNLEPDSEDIEYDEIFP